jgi:hypothetical protein
MTFSVASDLKLQSVSIDLRCQWPPENKIAVANFTYPGKNASKKHTGHDEVSIVTGPYTDAGRWQFMFRSRYFRRMMFARAA